MPDREAACIDAFPGGESFVAARGAGNGALAWRESFVAAGVAGYEALGWRVAFVAAGEAGHDAFQSGETLAAGASGWIPSGRGGWGSGGGIYGWGEMET